MPGEFGFFVWNVFAQPRGYRILGFARLVDGLRVQVALLKTQYERAVLVEHGRLSPPRWSVVTRTGGDIWAFKIKTLLHLIPVELKIPDGVLRAEQYAICALREKTNRNYAAGRFPRRGGWSRRGSSYAVTGNRLPVLFRITHLVTSPFAFPLFRHISAHLSRRNGDSCTTTTAVRRAHSS